MKKNLLSIMAAGVTALLMLNSANAQVAMNTTTGLTAIDNDYSKAKIPAADVNFRTLKDFKKRFDATTNATWHETDKGYIARFSTGSGETMVSYGKHGTWFFTINRYNEKDMPADVRALVKSTYYDYTILGIDEVNMPEQKSAIYILRLRDNKNFKTVRVCDNEMEVVADFHE